LIRNEKTLKANTLQEISIKHKPLHQSKLGRGVGKLLRNDYYLPNSIGIIAH